jgi:Uma2 family endonuclease
MTVATLMTADELLRLPDDGQRHELVQGELRTMSPSGADHGWVAAIIIGSLMQHVRQHRSGRVYAADAGFRIGRNPDTVRAPDGAFVRADRVVNTRGFFEGPPDLAVEVISPSDSYTEVEEKTLAWLRAGVRAVLIVDPRSETVRVHRTTGASIVNDIIEIDDVLPGWRLPVAEVFSPV